MGQRQSAGLLMYRRSGGSLEVFLAHPGGPIFANRDEGAWSIPKGEFESKESPMETALREFQEETGITPATREFLPLGSIQQKGGKIVHAWAFEDLSGKAQFQGSNIIEIEWPPKSNQVISIPEIDRAEYVSIPVAKQKIKSRQIPFLERLVAALA